MGDERFSAEHHLRKRPEYLRVYERGWRAHGRMAVIFCLRRGAADPWRLGLTATRKSGKAVARNRMRRRTREFFRRRRLEIPPGWDFVVNLKRPAATAPFVEFERDLTNILRRLGFPAEPDPEREEGKR